MKIVSGVLLLTLISCSHLPQNKNDKIYVVERERESLFVLENNNEKIIPGLGNLNHATMKFRDGSGYVLARDGYISKVDIASDKVVKKVKIGKSGIGITFIGNFIAVVNYDPNSVVILDNDLNVIKTIETNSRNVGIKSYKDKLIFSLMDKNELWVLDASHDFEKVHVENNIGALPFDALINENKYVVGFFNESAVGVFDLDTYKYLKVSLKDPEDKLVFKVPHFGYWGIVGNKAIVPLVSLNKLLVLNLKDLSIHKTIDLIGNPVFAAVSPNKEKLVVNYSGDKENFISVVDLKNLTKERDLKVAERVMHLRFSADGGKVFVTSYFENALKVLDTKNWEVISEKKVATPSGIFMSSMKE